MQPPNLPQSKRPEALKKSTSKFITNRGETLNDRIKAIIYDNGTNIVYLDFLVGYFRISGFKHLYEIIKMKLSSLKEIRILVGIDTDVFFEDMRQKGLNILKAKPDDFLKIFCKEQAHYLDGKTYSREPEEAFEELVKAIQEQRFQMRIVRGGKVHAKFYIFSGEASKIKGGDSYRYTGSVIVGSSNLSHNGLIKHYEFNAELRDSDDIENALYEFNELWKDGIEVQEKDLRAIKDASYLKDITAKDLYYKLLIEYFGEERIVFDRGLEKLSFPKDYKALKYQIYAIKEGIAKLDQYNGFFLSDVVGLGKTLIVTLIAYVLEVNARLAGHILIVCPPALEENWKESFRNVGVQRNWEICTHGRLHRVNDSEQYGLIIVDESHRFKSGNSQRYEQLAEICKNNQRYVKKIILISATPQNNSPKDLANQIYLFRDKRSSFIGAVRNLQDFFSSNEKEYSQIKKDLKNLKEGNEEEKKQLQGRLKQLSERMRKEVVQHVMVRRTRGDIERLFGADLKEQNICFPKINKPVFLKYGLSEREKELSWETLKFLDLQPSCFGKYHYIRYLIYPNLVEEGKIVYRGKTRKDDDFYEQTAERLKGLMQSLFFKRFESSVEAFLQTISKQLYFIALLIEMFNRGAEVIFPEQDMDFEEYVELFDLDDESDKEKWDLDLEDSDRLSEALEKFQEKAKNDSKYFKFLEVKHFNKLFHQKLQEDFQSLKNLVTQWRELKKDAKLQELKRYLIEEMKKQIKARDQREDGPKVILFTEAKTTAKYIFKDLVDESESEFYKGRLKKELIDEIKKEVSFDFSIGVLQVDASNCKNLINTIKQNFDANSKTMSDEYHILISTDTLSEGVNLHRSNVLVNYDAPWNPARLMQRAGRINRIGTKYERIEVYHFKPSEVGEEILKLEKKIFQKVQSFHYTLGEDSIIYSLDEDVEGGGIYQMMAEQEEEFDPEVPYLAEIIELYEKDKNEFKRIKELKRKIRSVVYGEEESFFYLKQEISEKYKDGYINKMTKDYFYRIQEKKGEIDEVDFCAMAGHLKECINKNISQKTSSKDLHYAHAKKVLDHHKMKITQPPKEVNPEEIKFREAEMAISLIKISKEDKECLKEGLRRGLIDLKEQKKIIKGKADIQEILSRLSYQIRSDHLKGDVEISYPEPLIQLSYTALNKKA